MKMLNCFIVALLYFNSCYGYDKKDDLNWNKPNLKGHWKLCDTKKVDDVPFLQLQTPPLDPAELIAEDSPWDNYQKFDLVFENDSVYKMNYPVQTQAPIQYFIDTGYLHLRIGNTLNTYPVELVNDTLYLYTPVPGFGFFKEAFVPTKFNNHTLNALKKYGINYPELAGTWILIRELDYDYGTHYELQFPYKLPNSIQFSQKQMKYALEHEKIYLMSTDGVKSEYSFEYRAPYIYFTPGKWYKKGDPPMIFFEKK